jgi:hypothetical protein
MEDTMSDPDRRCRICRRPQVEGGVCIICEDREAEAREMLAEQAAERCDYYTEDYGCPDD